MERWGKERGTFASGTKAETSVVGKLVINMRIEQTRKHVEDNGNQISVGMKSGKARTCGVELVLGVSV